MDARPIRIPIFAGQGSESISASSTYQQAVAEAATPSGRVLTKSFHQAFLAELSSLSEIDLKRSKIRLEDFPTADSLLSQSQARLYARNPIISSSYLFLVQSLRFLFSVENSSTELGSEDPFLEMLRTNREHAVGVFGFSSGILMSCVVATSASIVSYLCRAVDVYRISLRIGIRSQSFRFSMLRNSDVSEETNLPWSVVVSGLPLAGFTDAVQSFSRKYPDTPVYLTAIMEDTFWTVSGRPDHLALFIPSISKGHSVTTYATTLDALYHCQPLNGVRAHVMDDVHTRRLAFPEFKDLILPIRSTIDGSLLTDQLHNSSLLEVVLDMILVEPVRWDLTLERVTPILAENHTIHILNAGPGVGLIHSLRRVFNISRVSIFDLNSSDPISLPNQPKQEPIAIIGMAVNMPGASNVDELWDIIEKGINTVSEIPTSRFKVDAYKEGITSKLPSGTRYGHFVEDADMFDNRFFQISPREAKNMDPQQRILLHTAYDALDDAGYVPYGTPSFNPETFACFIGAATSDYAHNLSRDIDVHYSTGTLRAFLSGRLSYAMRFGGPSMVVDTACSSSLAAIHQGVRCLSNGDCSAALVGGVNIITCPETFIGLGRGHFLSPTGSSRPFDASADGYVRGEGCGVFILKRLSDAIAENDHVWGVIRAVEINQSGLASSITHPHPDSQVRLLRKVLEASALQANDITVVEAHGAGTQAGDPSEIESIRSVFSRQRTSGNPLHITSIKGNIGHLEAASGAASLAKLLLMMKRKVIPKQISFNALHPCIAPLASDQCIVDIQPVPWDLPHPGSRRAALLNNYGAAGSNAALVVQEYNSAQKPPRDNEIDHFVFAISAKNAVAVETLRSYYLKWLEKQQNLSISDIAYSSTARRRLYNTRIAVSTHSIHDLMEKLAIAPVIQVSAKETQSVFVFSGQGSQYLGMGQALYRTCQFFREGIDHCNDVLVGAGFSGCLPIINPDSDPALECVEAIEMQQASLVALQYVLAKLWISWGLKPDVVIGHSLGEYAALAIAGILRIEDVLLLAATRAQLLLQNCVAGVTGMLAVQASKQALQEILSTSDKFGTVSISCMNGPSDHVLSGSLEEIKALQIVLSDEHGIWTNLLDVPFGYHSQTMDPILCSLRELAQTLNFRTPSIPFASSVLGRTIYPEDGYTLDAAYFSRHCRQPVHFDEGLRSILLRPSLPTSNAWIEIGPHPQMISIIKKRPETTFDDIFIASLRKQESVWKTLAASFCSLHHAGVDLNWSAIARSMHPSSCFVKIPSYPFSKSRFWVPYDQSSDVGGGRTELEHPTLYSCIPYPHSENSFIALSETPIHDLHEFMLGHNVGGVPLCPASIYLTQVLSMVLNTHEYAPTDRLCVLRHVDFPNPLVYNQDSDLTITVKLAFRGDSGSFTVVSNQDNLIHVEGDYRLRQSQCIDSKFARLSETLEIQMKSLLLHSDLRKKEVFHTRTIYDVIFPRVVEYSEDYHLIETMTVDFERMEGCARISHPGKPVGRKFPVDPYFLDAIVHTAGFIANLKGAPNDAYICSGTGSVKIVLSSLQAGSAYSVFCTNAWVPEEGKIYMDAYVFTTDSSLVASIKDMQFRHVRLDRLKRGLLSVSRSRSSSLTLSRPGSSTSPHLPPSTSYIDSEELSKYKSPFPYHTEPDQSDVMPICERKSLLLKILSTVLDISFSELTDTAYLTDLGMDSLASIEATQMLQHGFQLDFPSNLLSSFQTIESLHSYFAHRLIPCNQLSPPLSDYSHQAQIEDDAWLSVFRLQSSDRGRSPLFLIHDGSGLITHYERLSSLEREVWAIQYCRPGQETDMESITVLAEEYAALIVGRGVVSVILGGWSFGGVVSYEVGLRLVARGVTVLGVVLIDSPSPEVEAALPIDLVDCILERYFSKNSSRRLLRERFIRSSRMLSEHRFTKPSATCPPVAFLRSKDPIVIPYHGDTPSWLLDREDPESIIAGWKALINMVIPTVDIPGDHFQAFEHENIETISSCLREVCEQLDSDPHSLSA